MQTFYYVDEAKETIRESLLTDRAKSWAVSFINPKKPRDKWQRNPKLTSAQLRKFHIEAKTLEERIKNLDNPNEEFPKLRPLVKMLKSKVAYACPTTGRDRKIPEEFRKYIEEMVDNIADLKDFKAFAL
ncbi:type III-A CRISPR-associated protein Csm2 [bacterium]|nr:type III-A CRISPR-associated protein Csm2 [bacterium]